MAKVAINLSTGSIQQEEIIVGIDLGTTNSLVAYIHPDGRHPVAINDQGRGTIVPSVVHFPGAATHPLWAPMLKNTCLRSRRTRFIP
ncbi:Hsp70 family protein [Hymenobacter sp. 5516J-16]|uniref:Hsp70 family protein n=1 Tax=Hymenobacter sp. 5516J-16 TaxID=2932253 RepID=UPI0021D41ACC|nr:Hsp70 family protein [Hymenobacter sp. 5516J-16]